MRIGVAAPTAVPYVRGGHERVCSGLVDHLNEATEHQAELFKIPFPEADLHQVVDGYRRSAALGDLGVDLLITGKYPAWAIRHPNHVVYMAHPLRGLYDAYPEHLGHTAHRDAEADRLWFDQVRGPDRLDAVLDRFAALVDILGPEHPAFAFPGPLARAVVHALDRVSLDPARIRRYAAISATVAGRPGYFPDGVAVAVTHHPSTLQLRTAPARRWFSTASRLDAPKRIDLIVQAMAHVDADVPLRIAGTGPDMQRVAALAEGDRRIELLGYCSDNDLADLYAGSIAVPFVPRDEDLGLITVEAMGSGVPVVTSHDSGGPTELVVDGVNGFVTDPTPEALGAVLQRLATDSELADRLGEQARATAEEVTWSHVTAVLTGAGPVRGGEPAGGEEPASGATPARRSRVPASALPSPPIPRRRGHPLLVVLTTYGVHPARHGGQLRCRHLYGGLGERFDVVLLSLVESGAEARDVPMGHSAVERQIPRSVEQSRLEWEHSTAAGIPMGDLYGGLFIDRTPAYLSELADLLRSASLVSLAQPYMEPALAQLGFGGSVVYDAQNLEVLLKSEAVACTPGGDRARLRVRAVERAALDRADLLVVCSEADRRGFAEQYGELPPVHVSPNGADVASTAFVDLAERAERRSRWLADFSGDDGGSGTCPRRMALFIGSWHPPNLEAARCLHRTAVDLPDVLFVMAGSHTLAFADEDLPANVAQVGMVGDLSKTVLLGAADVALNPITTGSGTNLKLLEYLAAGIPTVTTAHGGRGVLDAGEDVAEVVDAHDFGAGIERALRADAQVRRRALAGRRLVEERYDWSVIAGSLSDRLAALVPTR